MCKGISEDSGGVLPCFAKKSFKSFVKPDRQRIILHGNNKETHDWYEQESVAEKIVRC